MKLKEIIEKLEIGHIIRELIKVEVSHIPLITKRSIMNSVADLSLYINEESQMMSRDLILQEMFTTLLVLLETTDIELEGLVDENGDVDVEAALNIYDDIMKHGIYHFVCENVTNNDLEYLIESEIDQRITTHNSIASVLARTLQSLTSLLPSETKLMDAMKELPGMLGNLQILGGEKKPRKAKK